MRIVSVRRLLELIAVVILASDAQADDTARQAIWN